VRNTFKWQCADKGVGSETEKKERGGSGGEGGGADRPKMKKTMKGSGEL